MGSGALLVNAVVFAFHPAWWALLYQLPLALGLAYVVARQQARQEIANQALWRVALLAGGGGTLVFWLIMCLGANVLLLLLAIAVTWVGTSFVLDKHLDVDWETSQRITGLICGTIWLAWLIVGAVVRVIGAMG